MKLTIRSKLILYLIFPILLLFSVYFLYSSYEIQKVVLQNHEQNYHRLVTSFIETTDQVLKNGVNLATQTAQILEQIGDYNEAEIIELQKSILENEKVILGIAVAFAPREFRGKELFAPFTFRQNDSIKVLDIAEPEIGYNYTSGDYSWYTVPSQAKTPHWTEPFESGVVHGLKVVAYSHPIISRGNFIGVVVIDFSLDKLNQHLADKNSSESDRLIILSKTGKYISHPSKEKIAVKTIFNDSTSILSLEERNSLGGKMLSGKTNFEEFSNVNNQQKILAFFAPIKTTNWSLVVYKDKDNLLAPLTKIFKMAFLFIALLFVSSLFFVAFITNKLSKPIRLIKDFSKNITNGSYEKPLVINSKDEYQDLSKDLNYMGETLQKRENDLRMLNLELENKVEQRTQELKNKNEEITLINKYITDSINYAKQIQDAILPSNHFFESLFPNYFLIFSPKDVVSGDFYWVSEVDDKKIFAVIDCTGHGVPGALMSMIGNTHLNEIVNIMKITDPGEILNNLDRRVIKELQKDVNSHAYDGMDMSIGVYVKNENKLFVASAYRPIYYIQNDILNEIKGQRKSIGDPKKKLSFTTTEILIRSETVVYLFTDGITDQNNLNNEKFSAKRLKAFLLENHKKELVEQNKMLSETIANHKGTEIQRDDIAFMGLRLNPITTLNVIEFMGAITHEMIVSLGEELNKGLEKIVSAKASKTIFFCVNELLQNISHYAQEKSTIESKEFGVGSIQVVKNDNIIKIIASNIADEPTYKRLSELITNYNSLNEEELKSLRKEKLKSEREENSKGGGIGFIEIIKRTKSPIVVNQEVNENGNIKVILTVSLKLGVIDG